MRHRWREIVAAAVLVAAAMPAGARGESYALTVVGPGVGLGVNSSGQVAGYVGTGGGNNQGFVSGPNGMGLTNLGPLPGDAYSQANGVNATGQVAGTSGGNSDQQAFFYDPNTGLRGLGFLGGGSFTVGNGINDSGQVVGAAFDVNFNQQAFLSAANGGALTGLGILQGGSYSFGSAVNDAGEVAGYGDNAVGATHAIYWDTSGPTPVATDLGTLIGQANGTAPSADTNTSYGYAINGLGQVTGVSDASLDGTIQHAFLSGSGGGGLIDLGTLGGIYSEGDGVNTLGQVVGTSTTADGSQHAFLYSNNTMIDLNSLIDPSLGFTLVDAESISDSGLIAGYGSNSMGQEEAFLLSPVTVPEPSSLALMALAGASLAVGSSHLRRSKARGSVARDCGVAPIAP